MRHKIVRGSKRSLIMILIASISLMGSLLLKDVISVDMLRFHRETLLFVTLSDKIAFAALFVGLSLPGNAIASITSGFVFCSNCIGGDQ